MQWMERMSCGQLIKLNAARIGNVVPIYDPGFAIHLLSTTLSINFAGRRTRSAAASAKHRGAVCWPDAVKAAIRTAEAVDSWKAHVDRLTASGAATGDAQILSRRP